MFRVDASLRIGNGHLMRCLTLAEELRAQGAECLFICRKHEGNLLDRIEKQGYQVRALTGADNEVFYRSQRAVPAHADWLGTDWGSDAAETLQALSGEVADWLVVDHYALNWRWEQALRVACRSLMVIDDLADRRHDCDLLLDQNLGRKGEDYDGLIPAGTVRLIGPSNALLRREFAGLREASLSARQLPQLKRILVTMGGVDKDNATGQALTALSACLLKPELQITVVMGPKAPWLRQIQEQAEQMNCATRVLVDVKDMAQLMAESDLAIGAAGGTAWERCCLALPSIVCVLAENQLQGGRALQQAGAAILIQGLKELPAVMGEILRSGHGSAMLRRMSLAAAGVTDGSGAESVSRRMLASPRMK